MRWNKTYLLKYFCLNFVSHALFLLTKYNAPNVYWQNIISFTFVFSSYSRRLSYFFLHNIHGLYAYNFVFQAAIHCNAKIWRDNNVTWYTLACSETCEPGNAKRICNSEQGHKYQITNVRVLKDNPAKHVNAGERQHVKNGC